MNRFDVAVLSMMALFIILAIVGTWYGISHPPMR